MASRDVQGTSTGSRMQQAFDRARQNEEMESEQESNIAVGDFISELATAIKFRMKLGLSQGDWIEEPERYFTDGLVFATEEATASNVKLQITVSMDASTSMWANNLMRFAGPTFIALDRIIRKAVADLPEGSVHYAPFIFHGKALKLPAAFLNNYVGRVDWKSREDKAHESPWPNFPAWDSWTRARELGQVPAESRYTDWPLSGKDTRLAPLFQAIKDWEEKEGDTSAVRLDIVITDGVLENDEDVKEATRIQEDRNGKLRTVFLNFLPLKEWSESQLPERCSQFAVTKDDLDQSIRTILNDAVADLFA
jgi:hypothetical protein